MKKKLTTNEQQYALDLIKRRYDDLYKGQRDGSLDWESADEEKEINRAVQAKLLGHSVDRAGYQYR